MKKILNWVLAATLVCGLAVFTSCSSDNDDNPAQEQAKKNRKEFVSHTRSVMKDLAENLNFFSWTSASLINQHINWKILNNPEFEKTISTAFFMKPLLILLRTIPSLNPQDISLSLKFLFTYAQIPLLVKETLIK